MANKLMDESIALQQRPLGNYADALGKSYKDLEDRLKKEQGGGFWSGLGVNFLNKAIIDPLATQATESISDLISSPFEQNYEEFYQQKEQIEAKRLVRKAAEKSTQLQTQETERRKQGLNVVDYLTDSVQTKQRAREEFIKTALEAGKHIPAGYTPAVIDQLTKESRKAWAEKFAPLYENQVELSENLVDEESMKKLQRDSNPRAKNGFESLGNVFRKGTAEDRDNAAAKAFFESDQFKGYQAFEDAIEAYENGGGIEDLQERIQKIDRSAITIGITSSEEIKFEKVGGGYVQETLYTTTVDKNTGKATVIPTKLGEKFDPTSSKKDVLKALKKPAEIIKGYGFSNEGKAEIEKILSEKYGLNIWKTYEEGNNKYSLTTYDKQVADIIKFSQDTEKFVDFNDETKKLVVAYNDSLNRNARYLESKLTALRARPTDGGKPLPDSDDRVKNWLTNKRAASAELASLLTEGQRVSKIMVGIQAGQIAYVISDGEVTAVPKFHTLVEGSDPNNPQFVRLLDKNNTKIGSDADAEKATEKYFQWKSGKSGRFKGATNKTDAELAIIEKKLKDATVGNRQVVDTSAVTAGGAAPLSKQSSFVVKSSSPDKLVKQIKNLATDFGGDIQAKIKFLESRRQNAIDNPPNNLKEAKELVGMGSYGILKNMVQFNSEVGALTKNAVPNYYDRLIAKERKKLKDSLATKKDILKNKLRLEKMRKATSLLSLPRD